MKKNYFSYLFKVSIGAFLFLSSIFYADVHAQINFDQSELDFNGYAAPSGVTSLMYGPDGRLYVAEYPGTILIYSIERISSTNYVVTGVESLSGVKNIVNHDDDGTPCSGSGNACSSRETTGLTVGGTASNPIIYVSSSDFRIGAGPSGGNGDLGLDTNSGVITRLSWKGSSWDVVDLVRGLPRSEENHATNGLEVTTINGTEYLIVASGGITNGGSPSENFVYTCEYALSGAILAVDLDAINALPVQTDVNGRDYIYDLPTLDDPTRTNMNGIDDPNAPGYDGIDVNDPWGGNDGLNQAMIVPDGPVQILAPGFRNAYDIVVTESGALYATDNGANGGWGGFPVNEGTANVTNDYDPLEPGSQSPSGGEFINNKDHLELITTDLQTYTFGSFYGGHPNPTRANPAGAGLFTVPNQNGTDGAVFRTEIFGSTTNNPDIALPANWPPLPLEMANPVEGDWRGPGIDNPDGPEDAPVVIWGTNTNGIDEYTASNFGGAMQGDLIAGVNSGDLRRVELNGDGTLENFTAVFLSVNGGNALGITCNSDTDIFPGTIWAGTLGGKIVSFEPQDFVECDNPAGDPLADFDNDGYTNQDELDNGTDPCNGGSQPADFDKSAGTPYVSDLNDEDDDNDSILDQNDPFQLGDPEVGGSDAFTVPINNDFFNDQQGLGGIFGLGLTGLMNNGDPNPNYLNWLDRKDDPNDPNPNDVLGGAPGLMTSHMTSGTANGSTNTQEKGYQYGVQVDQSTGVFTVIGNLIGLVGPLRIYGNTAAVGGELGYFIGDGTQSNFIKMVVTTNGITALQEIDDVPQTPIDITIDELDRPGSEIVFYFMVDPSNGEVTLQYEFDGGGRITAGTITAQGSILDAIQQSNQDLAVGLIGTSNTEGVELEGTWDFLNVVGQEPTLSQEIPDITKIVDSADENINLDNFFADDYGDANLTYSVENNTDTNIVTALNGNELTLSFPSVTAISDITIRATDSDGFFIEDTFNVTVSDAPVVLYRVNAGGPELAAIDGGMVWGADELGNSSPYLLDPANDKVYESSVMPVDGSVNQSTTPLEIYATERFDDIAGLPNLTYAFPVPESGNYEVRLYMGNSYPLSSEPGERVFDVAIEGTILPLLNDIDLSGTYGHQIGTVITHTLKVSDGTLNISFSHGAAENPLINAIEILDASDNDTPIYVHPIADQIGNVGEQLNGSLGVSAYGGDGNMQYSATGLPPGLVIGQVDGVISGTIDETAAAGSPYNVTITVDDSDGLTSDAVSVDFSWTVTETFAVRINAGGNQVSPTDIGPKWEDNATNGAQIGGNYTVNTGSITDFEGTTYANRDSSIPAYMDNGTFAEIFEEDRFDPSSAPEMEYTLALDNGDYVVNLYIANAYDGASEVGDRIFDILIEGDLVEDNFDVIDSFGHEVAGMLSYPVEVADGELNILFNHDVAENPLVNAIEIFKVDANNPTLTLANISDKTNEITNSVNIMASATGGDPETDVTYYMSGHPDGVSIDPATGEITGTITVAAANGGPNNDGIHTVVVTAMKPLSAPSSQVFTWTIDSQYLWNDKDENLNYTARHENSFVQAGDKFYLMGGRESAQTIDIYDYTTDTWTSLVDSAPFELNHFQATEYNGLIWVIGAFKTNNFPNEVPADYIWMFDPVSQEWIQGPEIPENRRRGSTGLVVHNDKFYIVGGNTDGHAGGYVAWFDEYDPATGTWTPLADAPIARDHFAAVVIGNKLYVAAGRQSGGETTWRPTIPQVDVYDFTTGTWSTLPSGQDIPTPRGGASAVNFNNKLVVIGGEVQDEVVYGVETDDALKITEEYDPVSSSWKRLPDMNYERHGTQAIVSGTGVHILAGAPNRGGGNQKNMEYLGEDNPVGTPSVASTLSVPSTVVIADGETVDIDLSLIDGNVGLFVKSMEISGANAADFSIDTGELENMLMNPNETRTLSVTLSGTGADRTAILTINYGNSDTASIALTNNPDATFSVTNPGDQYNYEGDDVSLQVEATSPNVTTYSATGLPPNLTINENTGVISGTIDDGFISGGSNVFQEDNGLLIIEAETDFDDTSGGFDILTESETTYLIATTDHFGNTNGQTVSYEFQIDNPGVYRFHMKSEFSGGSSTDKNDIWFKVDNTPDVHFFTVQGGDLTSTSEFENILGGGTSSKIIYYPGGNLEGRPDYGSLNPGVNGFFKLWRTGPEANKWDGQTIDEKGYPVYAYFPSAGTYTIQASERSEGHKLDKFALAHIDLVGTGEPIATLDGPESQQGDDIYGDGASVDSPYNVSVTVTDNGDPAGNETIDFLWYIGASGDLIAVPQADITTGVVPLTVNFTGSNSLDDVGVTTYSWSFNDGTGATSIEPNPTHEFMEIGTYVVDLTVEDADGGTDTKSINIEVTGTGIPPTAVASANVVEGEAALEVIFTGSASTDDLGVIENYAWDFGDSNSSTEQNPTHTYTTAGMYTAVLTVTDIEGLTDTAEVDITVNQPNDAPIAEALASQESGTAPLQVDFTGSGSSDDVGIITYAWDFDDGGVSPEQNPTYTFNTTGVYDVVLTVTDGGGLTGTDTLTITVTNQNPVAVVAATPDAGEAPLEVSFTGSGSTDNIAVDTYSWDFGDGSNSTEADPIHTYTDPGNYTAELTVTDNEGATATASVLIQVTQVGGNEAPEAVASANPTQGEAPLPVTFNAGGSSDDVGIDTYFWEFSDGSTSDQMNPTLTFENAGTYDATLTVTDEAGLSDSATIQIVVTEAAENQAPEAVISATPESGNAPLEVSFMGGNSLDDVGVESYAWDFGDGNSSTETNPIHTYNTPGTYTAILTVTDGEGLTDTATVNIVVTEEGGNQAPEAVASATPDSGNAPLEVTFIGNNSNDEGPLTYSWNFGDGNTSTEPNPIHIYDDPGTYIVELTVMDAEGLTDTATITVVVTVLGGNQAPEAVASATPDSGNAPLEVSFTGDNSIDDTGVVSYAWDFGDGGTSTETNPIHTYNTPGTYMATLTVTDGEGLTDTATVNIVVTEVGGNQAPEAVAAATPDSGNAPLEVTFLGSNSTDDEGPLTYSWNFGDGNTSTEPNPTHVYNNPSIYIAELTVTDLEGLTDTMAITIQVTEVGGNQVPEAVASATPDSGNAPLEVTFIGNNSNDEGPLSYSWNFGDGNTSTEPNPIHIYDDPGTYIVELTVMDAEGLTDTATITVVVTVVGGNQAPDAVASATPDSGNAPLEVTFLGSNSTDDEGPLTYSWNFGDGNTSTEPNPTHVYNNPSTYIAELTVTDLEGLTDTVAITIQVTEEGGNQAPEAVASANPTQGQAPLAVIFNGEASTDDTGIDTYFWEFSDGRTSNQMNPTLTFENAGTYDATLTVTDEAGLSDSATIQIVVTEATENQAPEAAASANLTQGQAPLEVSFMGSNSTDDVEIVSYAWDFGDGNSSTDADPTHTYNEVGNYTAQLTVTDGEGLTDTATVDIEVVEDSETTASVAPNPVPINEDYASIQLSQLPHDDVVVTSIHLHDSMGRLVETFDPAQTYDTDLEVYRIPIFMLRSGLYYATLELSDGDPIGIKFLVSN